MSVCLEKQSGVITKNLPYGTRTISAVGPDLSPVWSYLPHDAQEVHAQSTRLVIFTGLLATPREYDPLCQNLLRLGDETHVFGYDHHHHKWPIRANADTAIHAIKDLHLTDFTIIGHSLGTIAALLALEDPYVKKQTKTLIQCNPAMTGNHFLPHVEDVGNVLREASLLSIFHPRQAVGYTVSAVNEVISRKRVVAKQTIRLLSGQIHHRYNELMQEQDGLPVHVIFNTHDGLVPPRWANSLSDKNIQIHIHHSASLLGHAAITLDPEYAEGLHNIANGLTLPKNFRHYP